MADYKSTYEEEYAKAKSKHKFKKHMRKEARTKAWARTKATAKYGKTTAIIRGVKAVGRGAGMAGKALSEQQRKTYTQPQRKKGKKKYKGTKSKYILRGGVAYKVAGSGKKRKKGKKKVQPKRRSTANFIDDIDRTFGRF